jgi:hypothetical protein
MVIGDDDAGRIDDETGAERVDAARRLIGIVAALAALPAWAAVAPLAAMVLEKLIEEFLHRRAGRQIRQFGDARIDFLRRRDVDDGVDDLLGNVRDIVRTPCRRCRGPRRQDDDRRRERGDRHAMRQKPGEMAGGETARVGRHGRQRS